MTQYRVTQTEFTDADGEHFQTYHYFPIGTLVELVSLEDSDAPYTVAVDGPDAGCFQYVPYACMEIVPEGTV